MRSGNCVFGSESCERGLKSGKVNLVILDAAVSQNTRKHFTDMCAYRNIDLIELKDCERLGRSIGKANIMIIGVTDSGFCMKLLKKFEEGSDTTSE